MMTSLRNMVAGAVMVLVIPALAFSVTLESTFTGFAQHDGAAPGDYTGATTYTAFMTLDTQQDNPWYPWDQLTYEYTAKLVAPISSFTVNPPFENIDFGVATVEIWEDNTTAADYGNQATFTDGTKVLSGVVQNMIGSRFQSFGLPFDVTGVLIFTGGSGIGNLDSQCATGVVLNDFIDFTFVTPPAGYQEQYRAQWKCPDTTGTEESTWGGVKSLYR